jgi:hypothetical protein
MTPIALALALFLADQPAAAPAPEAPAAEAPADIHPTGAPRDDYQFVAWCYGALRGYLELHDEVMPEVTRIESTFRPPNRKLSDDLKVYDDMQKDGVQKLKLFQGAMTAAVKASLQPINTLGGAAVRKGRSMWVGAGDISTRRKAQEWMSWALPAKCETTAASLEKRAKLMGATFKVNAEPEAPPPAEVPAPAAEAPSAPAPGAVR